MSDTAVEPTPADAPKDTSYQLGSINTDSLKEILSRFADAFPFVDETQATAFREQINSLHEAGNPHAEKVTPDERDAEIARLQAQLDELNANKTGNQP